MENGIATRDAGTVTRDEFGAIEVQRSAEVTQVAASARETAAIQARYIMAMNRPRDVERFRISLQKECRRVGFAEEAEYARPVGREERPDGTWGDKIARGPTIRLMEAAAAKYGNLLIQAPVIFENSEQRVISAFVVDLETNVSWERSIVIPKRVEKSGEWKNGKRTNNPPKGRIVVSQRSNSSGQISFLCEATDDEIAVKQSAMESKAQRKNLERSIPRDIIDECLAICAATVESGIKADPVLAIRKLLDAFASLNVMPDDLAEYLGKKIDQAQPAEIQKLRKIYKALAEGEATWQQVLENASGPEGGSAEAQRASADATLAKLRQQAASTTPTPPVDPPAETKPLNLRDEIAAWVKSLPDGKAILGAEGYETAEQVPDAKLADVLGVLKAAAPKKTGLNLGKK